MPQTEYVLDDTHEDMNVQFLNKDMVQMNYNLKNRFVDNNSNINIPIAAFTTSYAPEIL